MKWLRQYFIAVVIFFIGSAYAGQDPISWTMTGNLPAKTTVSNTYSLSYQFVNNLPFTMPGPLTILKSASTSEFTFTDGCSGQRLPAHGSCTVSVSFSPTTTGTKTMQLKMEYGNNLVPLPALDTETISSTSSQVAGVVKQSLPVAGRVNTTYTAVFTFSNSGGTAAEDVNITNNTSSIFHITSNTCSTTLSAGGSCSVTGTYSSASLGGPNTVSVTFSYLGGIPITLSSSITLVNPGAGRIFSVINNCAYPVWFSFNGAFVKSGCSSDSDCPTGSSCNVGANACFFNNPAPLSPAGQYQLAQNGGSNYAIVPDLILTQAFVWSGNLAGRTGCSGTTCDTASCNSTGGDDACSPGTGFSQPATQFEITLDRTHPDSYNVETINGFNLPVAAMPANAASPTSFPYICGNPGSTLPSNPLLGACSWNFSPPSNSFVWVKFESSPTTCTTDTDCTSGKVCGLSLNPTGDVFNKTCGVQLGYWSADQACGVNASSADPYFHCNSAMNPPIAGYTLTNILQCVKPDASAMPSCYSGGANNTCCGCVNWNTVGVNVPNSTYTTQCVSQNNDWISDVLPGILWLKQACPTFYTYPYDDPSSLFTCPQTVSGTNTTDYTMIFCPL